MKHILLARVLLHLKHKPSPFRVIDTHAGIGLYDLAGSEAVRTQEWRDGIARMEEPFASPEVEALLEPYRFVLSQVRERYGPLAYPGSPLLAATLLRKQDRAVFVEKHPEDIRRLAGRLRGDPRVSALGLDGWTALFATIPPKERRGVVLIDPPFEETDEFARLTQALVRAQAKWPTGIYAGWYPIKTLDTGDTLLQALPGHCPALRLELIIDSQGEPGRLNGCGLIVLNPPWTLEREARLLLPALAERLRREGCEGGWRCEAKGS